MNNQPHPSVNMDIPKPGEVTPKNTYHILKVPKYRGMSFVHPPEFVLHERLKADGIKSICPYRVGYAENRSSSKTGKKRNSPKSYPKVQNYLFVSVMPDQWFYLYKRGLLNKFICNTAHNGDVTIAEFEKADIYRQISHLGPSYSFSSDGTRNKTLADTFTSEVDKCFEKFDIGEQVQFKSGWLEGVKLVIKKTVDSKGVVTFEMAGKEHTQTVDLGDLMRVAA